MKIYVGKIPGVDVTLPKRGSELAAGYDIIATSEPKIVGEKLDESNWSRIDYVEYETNLYIAPEATTWNLHTLIYPRSSVSKYNLVLANSIGLVDNDYRGMIICRFKYIWQPEDFSFTSDDLGNFQRLVGSVNVEKLYKKGDKIAQLVFQPTVQVEFELVEELQTTQRGTGGFGSTDTIRIERPKTTENVIGGSTLVSLPPGILPEQKIEVDTDPKPKYSEENKYVGQNSIMEQWLKKGAHSAPPASYEKLVKEREKNL